MNYTKIYNNIIFNTQSLCRKRLNRSNKDYVYYELHHMIPKCIGGNNDKSNLVLLTAREHFVAHLLLVKMHPKNLKLVQAALMMSVCNGKNDRNTNKSYEKLRIERSVQLTGRNLSEDHKNKISKSNKGGIKPPRTEEHSRKISESKKGKQQSSESVEKRATALRGKPLSDEHKKSIKDSKNSKPNPLSGKPLSDEHKNLISESLKGIPKTDSHREKLSKWQKGIKKSPLSEDTKNKISSSLLGKEKPKIQCICGIIGSVGHLKRWHKDHFILPETSGLI